MEIVLIITGGLVLMTFFAAGFDFLTKRRNKKDNAAMAKVAELEKRLARLESALEDRNDRLLQMENDISFMTKLLEDKK